LDSYCASPNQCSKGHPNSQINCKTRGTHIHLMTYDEAVQVMKQRTEYTYEETANTFGKRVRNVNVHKLVTGSISFRVQNEAQTDFISYIMAKTGTNKITDALHHIINNAIANDAGFLAAHAATRAANAQIPNEELKIEGTEDTREPRERLQQMPTRAYSPQPADEGVFTL